MNKMTQGLFLTIWMCMSALVGCSLDFNEAIPCDTDQHCPADMFCQLAEHRCELGSRTDDTTDLSDDAADDVVLQDPQVEPSDDPATTETDTATGSDVEPDSVDDADGGTDTAE